MKAIHIQGRIPAHYSPLGIRKYLFEQGIETYEYNLYSTETGELQLIAAKKDKCIEEPPITEGIIISTEESTFNLSLPWLQVESETKENQIIIEGDHSRYLQEEDEIEQESITKGTLNGKPVTIFTGSIDQAIKLAKTLKLPSILGLNFAEITLHRASAQFCPEFLGSIAQDN